MRLVVTYEVGDGCTYSCTRTLPIEYKSVDDLLIDLDDHCKKLLAANNWKERQALEYFKGIHIPSLFEEDGEYYLPTVRTLEEWFAGWNF
jgi:hypothetical protein